MYRVSNRINRLETDLFSLPYTVVGSAALIAKFTPQKDQAFMQSLRTLGERFAMILAQNWYANAIIAVTNYVSFSA